MHRVGWFIAILVLGTGLTYSGVTQLQFLHFDDDAYVTANAMVNHGLTVEGWRWAWTSFHASNWHPLTWLSHAVDCQLFHLNPAGHHLVNLLFHVANAVLLFLVLRQLTRQTGRSFVVAALFALHPLAVESVAWVAERKNVLSTFWGLLALAAYARYCRQPGLGRYGLVLAAFVLSLLSKPMLVTLPFVLLLLDGWPLQRLATTPLRWLVLEKVPLLLLSASVCLLTILAQRSQALAGLDWPLRTRLANALVSYVAYLGLMLWPVDLAILYPFDRSSLTLVNVVGSALFLLLVTGLVLACRRRQPALLVGWLWYLGTLVPVIGLVQVGAQSLADRYTYVPLIGIFLALTWAVPDSCFERPIGRVIQGAVAILLLGCATLTWFQVPHWSNDLTIWHRAREVTRNNVIAEQCWGSALARLGKLDEAKVCFQRSLEIQPGYGQALHNLGLILLQEGEVGQALDKLKQAVRQYPNDATFRNTLGLAQLRANQLEEARDCFRKAIELDPIGAEACWNLAFVLDAQGDREGAAAAAARGQQLDPAFAERAWRRAQYLLQLNNPKYRCLPEALFRAQQANVASGHRNPDMLLTLAEAWAVNGRPTEAVATARRALAVARETGRLNLLDAIQMRLQEYRSVQAKEKEAARP